MTLRLDAIRRVFPNALHLVITSEATRDYNCIALVMGDASRNWWPTGHGAAYWPGGVMREATRRGFGEAFAGFGYRPCADGSLEPGVEKVCLYEKGGAPTHAALQLPNGRWWSKLGPDEDVEHDLHDLEGRRYGRPTVWFARARRQSTDEGQGVIEGIVADAATRDV